MDIAWLLRDNDASEAMARIKALKQRVFDSSKLTVSDGEHKYVNLVLQGGGTLGIAYVGLLYALEQCGLRFSGIAGTSAGAILALAIAAARPCWSDSCSDQLLQLLASLPADEFVDGPSDVRCVIKAALAGDTRPSTLVSPSVIKRLITERGLNPGNAFLGWLSKTLARNYGIHTCSALEDRTRESPDLAVLRNGERHDLIKNRSVVGHRAVADRLRIVATGLPLGLKFVFPRDGILLELPDGPASFARASMSIPFFFDPYRLELGQGWRQHFAKALAGSATPSLLFKDDLESLRSIEFISFVDGGVLSNFPIDAFLAPSLRDHLSGVHPQSSPLDEAVLTVCISLSDGMGGPDMDPHDSLAWNHTLGGLLAFTGEIVQGMRYLRDREARARIRGLDPHGLRFAFQEIKTAPHYWLNFMLDEYDQRELFTRGMSAGVELVERMA